MLKRESTGVLMLPARQGRGYDEALKTMFRNKRKDVDTHQEKSTARGYTQSEQRLNVLSPQVANAHGKTAVRAKNIM